MPKRRAAGCRSHLPEEATLVLNERSLGLGPQAPAQCPRGSKERLCVARAPSSSDLGWRTVPLPA
eukprot:11540152-Alexandrium_andersonii.AAC.1